MWVSCCNLFSSSCIPRRSLRSSADSGSSRRSTSGCLARARASATRCCWPPDSWLGRRAPRSERRTRLSAACTLCVTSSFGSLSICSPKAMFWATVMWGKSAYDWKTVLTRRFQTGIPSIRSPRSRISPASGDSSPAMQRSRVVFPQPDGPSNTMNEPSATLRLTLSRAWTSPPSGVGKNFDTPRTCKAGAASSGNAAPPRMG